VDSQLGFTERFSLPIVSHECQAEFISTFLHNLPNTFRDNLFTTLQASSATASTVFLL
jgi:hypothetical protein